MIKLLMCRAFDSTSSSKYPRVNLMNKGLFIKNFESVEDMAKFFANDRKGALCIVRDNLSIEQRIAFSKKYRSLIRNTI